MFELIPWELLRAVGWMAGTVVSIGVIYTVVEAAVLLNKDLEEGGE